MAQYEMPNILGSFLQGQQAGQGDRRRKALSDYLQPALGGDPNALSQVYAADPDAGLQVQGMVQKQAGADREQKLGELELAARAWHAAPPEMRQQLYPGIAELTESVLPQFAGKIPREYSPAYEVNIDKFLSGFAGQQEQFTLSPGSARYDASGRQIVSQPFAPASMQPIQTDQGYASYNPKTGTAAPLNYEGQPAGVDQSKIQNALAMLAGGQGVQMTSGLRTPERNAAVGGKPNSQHLRGTAGDYVVPQDQKSAFIANAEAQGLQAIDEGDHIHVQQPRGGRVMPKQPERAPSALQERIVAAQAMGATEDDIRRMVIGREGAAAGAKPLPVQALNQLLGVEDALAGAKSVSAIIQKHADRMGSGALTVAPADAIGARLRTSVGMTNANDVNLNEFRADLTRIVNESLRLNSGVQTEGDAQRAAQELMAANDQATAARALRRLAEINRRAVDLQKQKQSLVRKNYGQDAEGNPLGQQRPQPLQYDDDALIGKYL